MASWLKAAEDLFEVVDRRAKLAAGDNPDEQLNLQTPASNGRGSQPKRTRPKAKTKKPLSSDETPVMVDTEIKQSIPETSQTEAVLDKDTAAQLAENSVVSPHSVTRTIVNEDQHGVGRAGSIAETPSPGDVINEDLKTDAGHIEAEATGQIEVVASDNNGEIAQKNVTDADEGTAPLSAGDLDRANLPTESSQSTVLGEAKFPANIRNDGSQISSSDAISDAEIQPRESDLKVESGPDQQRHSERSIVISSEKVQEQLDEAQGLLKNAISTGQSKEARLARICAGLSSRLQEYKSENAQLEELLVAERDLSRSYEESIKHLQKDLSVSKSEVTRVESNMADALATKNAEIEALVNSVDGLKRQAALAEGNLASLQANMESIMRNRELTETRMMQALREELAAAERRAEDERTAHNATKMAAMEREVELEHRAIEASTALARIQRTADERATKAAELEQKVALLEVECSTLNQELQDMETRARRGQKKSPEEANQAIQMQAWQEEVERARQGQRDAESKLSSMEAEVQKMRVEMASMKRDAEHYSRQEHMELEKRYRELTDLLYYKQTQLETMASEKAAAEFQLEKELKRLQEAQVEAERNRTSRRASSSWEEDTEIKALETLPLHHRHMVGASMQLHKAAKLLDSGAVRATKFLWRYPYARVVLLFYLVFVHLFLMHLLHRLQEQADTYASREVAESMGLANRTLP
ncbi:golgin candidate 1 [Coffea eugenioides]|uniref:Golgin candidate 1 n=1 Tax=Coffea arabica TaxID=13443 RepID=A0A6P6T2G1_COFAR|nr:golgin candidate 1-like [Coffea arabica]XP_027176961.1 golgin candidate 1 [Coffea eugenioides]